jgi:polyhydroxyalkanoate synthesis regulator phasin
MAEQPDQDEVVRKYAARLGKEPGDLTTEDYRTLIQEIRDEITAHEEIREAVSKVLRDVMDDEGSECE